MTPSQGNQTMVIKSTIQRREDLFTPPSFNRVSDSPGSTKLIKHPMKDVILVSLPTRKLDTREFISPNRDLHRSKEKKRDSNIVCPPSKRKGPRVQLVETRQSTSEKYFLWQEESRDDVEYVEKRQESKTLGDLKSFDSLISLPPPIRKRKGFFSKRHQHNEHKTSELIQRKSSVADQIHQDAIEIVLLSWTEHQMTVRIIDGRNNVIHSSHHPPKPTVVENKEKEKLSLPVQQAMHEVMPMDTWEFKSKSEEKQDKSAQQRHDMASQKSEGFFSEKSKGFLSRIFADWEERTEEDDDDDDDSSTGPDDIPQEIFYRNLPSSSMHYVSQESPHSCVITEDMIPIATSAEDISDVSSNSSDGSSDDWSSSDESSSEEENQLGFVQLVYKGKWSKKVIPFVRQLSRPVVRASSPMINALK